MSSPSHTVGQTAPGSALRQAPSTSGSAPSGGHHRTSPPPPGSVAEPCKTPRPEPRGGGRLTTVVPRAATAWTRNQRLPRSWPPVRTDVRSMLLMGAPVVFVRDRCPRLARTMPLFAAACTPSTGSLLQFKCEFDGLPQREQKSSVFYLSALSLNAPGNRLSFGGRFGAALNFQRPS